LDVKFVASATTSHSKALHSYLLNDAADRYAITAKNLAETATPKFRAPIDMALLFVGAVMTVIGQPGLRAMRITYRCGWMVLMRKKLGGEDGSVTS
jgi:hypothetical protein